MTPTHAQPLPATRWGILATGKIARQFAEDLLLVDDAVLSAVGSRRIEAAQGFADEFNARGPVTVHGSYEALVADPDVDVIYVATPHARHVDDVRMALEAGKHVLCEKPLTLNAADAEELFSLAAERGLFLMEAMWTACHPMIIELAERLRAGEFGRPGHLHAELGFVVADDPTSRLLDPRLGAGALLDMGIYPLTFAHLMLGEALSLSSHATLVRTEHGDYDAATVVVGSYPGGVLATMASSMNSWSSRAAAIATDRGRLTFDDFHHPTTVLFTPVKPKGSWTEEEGNFEPVEITAQGAVIGRGYGNEIAEVGRCLRAGLTESPRVSATQTLTLMRQLDQIRSQIGLAYDGGR